MGEIDEIFILHCLRNGLLWTVKEFVGLYRIYICVRTKNSLNLFNMYI